MPLVCEEYVMSRPLGHIAYVQVRMVDRSIVCLICRLLTRFCYSWDAWGYRSLSLFLWPLDVYGYWCVALSDCTCPAWLIDWFRWRAWTIHGGKLATQFLQSDLLYYIYYTLVKKKVLQCNDPAQTRRVLVVLFYKPISNTENLGFLRKVDHARLQWRKTKRG